MKTAQLNIVECFDLPENPDKNTIYKLLPQNPSEGFYRERTDRNIGWITESEQKMLRKIAVGIAGCGGMGGRIAELFLRLGIGEIRIADVENFDVTNINRQAAAYRDTVGKSKAFETAKWLRSISDDTVILVFPQGITPLTAPLFASGCAAICDEIEFWAIFARIILHQSARFAGVPVFCAPTVGFGTRLFLFTPESTTMEECIGFTPEEAEAIQVSVQKRTAQPEDIRKVMENVLSGLIPELPEYCSDGAEIKNRKFLAERLFGEGAATIIATNPALASGFIADHVLLHLLLDSGVERNVVRVPEMPGYLYFDAGHMIAKIVRKKWW